MTAVRAPGAPRTLGLVVRVAPGVIERMPRRPAGRLAPQDQLAGVGDLVEQHLEFAEAHLTLIRRVPAEGCALFALVVRSGPPVTDLADGDDADEEDERRHVGQGDQPMTRVGEDHHRPSMTITAGERRRPRRGGAVVTAGRWGR